MEKVWIFRIKNNKSACILYTFVEKNYSLEKREIRFILTISKFYTDLMPLLQVCFITGP